MKKIFSILFVLLLAGCANPYKDFYEPIANEDPEERAQYFAFLKDGQEPVIIKSANATQDLENMLSKRYAMIGISNFSAPMKDSELLISYAKELRATHVIYYTEFLSTHAGTVPVSMPNTQVANVSGTVGGRSFSGTSAATGSTYIPMTFRVDRYNHSAIFLVKNTRKPRFGMLFAELTPESRKEFERNSGVLISITVENSPVFKANVLAGDLLIKIDQADIINIKNLNEVLNSIPKGARKIDFRVVRNKKEMTIPVYLEE